MRTHFFIFALLLSGTVFAFAEETIGAGKALEQPEAAGVSEKLDKVLSDLQEIKDELQIIKIRASNR